MSVFVTPQDILRAHELLLRMKESKEKALFRRDAIRRADRQANEVRAERREARQSQGKLRGRAIRAYEKQSGGGRSFSGSAPPRPPRYSLVDALQDRHENENKLRAQGYEITNVLGHTAYFRPLTGIKYGRSSGQVLDDQKELIETQYEGEERLLDLSLTAKAEGRRENISFFKDTFAQSTESRSDFMDTLRVLLGGTG